jgi:thiosulfate/3-mercaptopyruvate sulfurtransferase
MRGVEPLIDVTSLARSLAAGPSPVLLDVRWRLAGSPGPPGLAAHRAGHLPGAVFIDLDHDLSGAPGAGGRHPLPGAAAFQLAMRRAGVSDGRDVVVYDEADATAAARGWWMLRYFGHLRVRVLDGGYRAWVAAGQPVVTGEGAAPPPGDFTASPGGMQLLDADGAAALARHGTLLDARAGERYRGEAEPIDPVAGHIPGAVSAPTAGNVLADGRFRPAPDLRARVCGPAWNPGGTAAPSQGCGPGRPQTRPEPAGQGGGARSWRAVSSSQVRIPAISAGVAGIQPSTATDAAVTAATTASLSASRAGRPCRTRAGKRARPRSGRRRPGTPGCGTPGRGRGAVRSASASPRPDLVRSVV